MAFASSLPNRHALFTLVKLTFFGVVSSLISGSYSLMLHRSAMFLFFFLVVHVCGNLLIFAGPEVMNEYARILHLVPILPLIQYYLLFAAIVHAVAALYFTKLKWKAVLPCPLSRGKLFFTGVAILGFVAIHIRQFKFGTMPAWRNSAGAEGKDVWGYTVCHFSDPVQVLLYAGGIAAVCAHLYVGWSKSVPKVPVPESEFPKIRMVGRLVNFAMCFGFVACPVYAYSLSSGTAQACASGVGTTEL